MLTLRLPPSLRLGVVFGVLLALEPAIEPPIRAAYETVNQAPRSLAARFSRARRRFMEAVAGVRPAQTTAQR